MKMLTVPRVRSIGLLGLMLFLVACMIAVFDIQVSQSWMWRIRERRLDTSQADSRPVIWTYYERANSTDMSSNGDQKLLWAWKDAWTRAGWQPKICTNADALKVEEYEELAALITDKKMIGSYDVGCFIRWIAMAGVGGGWMVDYDTFPLHSFVDEGKNPPNNGTLTIHEGWVPSLVSGSKEEYLRIARSIGEVIKEKISEGIRYTDMWALKDLYKAGGVEKPFIFSETVYPGEYLLNVTHIFTEEDCRMADGQRAAHFSHRAIKYGAQTLRGAENRGRIAHRFMQMWRANCEAKTPLSQLGKSKDILSVY